MIDARQRMKKTILIIAIALLALPAFAGVVLVQDKSCGDGSALPADAGKTAVCFSGSSASMIELGQSWTNIGLSAELDCGDSLPLQLTSPSDFVSLGICTQGEADLEEALDGAQQIDAYLLGLKDMLNRARLNYLKQIELEAASDPTGDAIE